MTNKMPVVGKRYVNKKTNKDYKLFCIVIMHKEAFYLENTKDDLASVETLVEFWNRFEELPEDNLQEKKEISKVERALEELKNYFSNNSSNHSEILNLASNLVNALETERNMSKPEPKIDMKEECVEPVSIWKDVSELPEEITNIHDSAIPCLVKDALGYTTIATFSVNAFYDWRKPYKAMEQGYLSTKSPIKWCYLHDFINSFEQIQKDIEELKRNKKEGK